MLDFYNTYKEKIIQFILYHFQRSIGINHLKPYLKIILFKK